MCGGPEENFLLLAGERRKCACALVDHDQDFLIVVAGDRFDAVGLEVLADFFREGAVAGQVAGAEDLLRAPFFGIGDGGFQGRQVRVDVGEEGG